MALPPRAEWRVIALRDASDRHPPVGLDRRPAPIHEVLHTATEIYDWLARPVQLTLTFVITDATGAATTQGATMSNVELGDNQQVTATVVPDDAAGQATTDTLTWTASVATAVSLTPSADTLSCVIDGLVPTEGVVITATDANGLTVSGTVDVIAGAATSLNLTFGAVTTVVPPAATDTVPAAAAGETETAGASA